MAASTVVRKAARIQPFCCTVRAKILTQNNLNLSPRTLLCVQQKISEVHGSSMSEKIRRKSDNANGNGNGTDRLQHFKRVLNQFVAGSKLLGSDVKQMVAIRKKLKASGHDWNILTVDETLHLIQVRKDLIKTLPAVLVFFIPFVGYAAPVIAFMYPKYLLSHHYWLPSQEKKFVKHDAAKRSNHYLPLVREVGRYALQKKAKDEDCKELLDVSLKTINKEHPSNEELLKFSENFTGEWLGFNHLPKYHLKRLSQVWMLSPWLPRRLLRGNLRLRLASIRKEDAALHRGGLNSLDETQIRRLCHLRGLDVQNLETEALKKWLQEWVELSSAAPDNDESFLAHVAVYKTMNYHRKPKATKSATSI